MSGGDERIADPGAALQAAGQAAHKNAVYTYYAGVGSMVLAWGIVWLVCNLTTFAVPEWRDRVWLIGITAGVIASAYFSFRSRNTLKPEAPTWTGPVTLVVLAAAAIALAVLAVRADGLGPVEGNAIVALLVALAYLLFGLRYGAWMAVLGLVLAAATVTGWVGLRPYFELWMGIVGGGALILGGARLRSL